MKYLRLNNEQLQKIVDFNNDYNKRIGSSLSLQKCKLQNGDELELIATKEMVNDQMHLKIFWCKANNDNAYNGAYY